MVSTNILTVQLQHGEKHSQTSIPVPLLHLLSIVLLASALLFPPDLELECKSKTSTGSYCLRGWKAHLSVSSWELSQQVSKYRIANITFRLSVLLNLLSGPPDCYSFYQLRISRSLTTFPSDEKSHNSDPGPLRVNKEITFENCTSETERLFLMHCCWDKSGGLDLVRTAPDSARCLRKFVAKEVTLKVIRAAKTNSSVLYEMKNIWTFLSNIAGPGQ